MLTPTEDLALNVLVARYRLGEKLWTFESRHKKALEKLQARGLVNLMHGITENTCRASLTEEAKKEHLIPEYEPPIFKAMGKKTRKRVRGTW